MSRQQQQQVILSSQMITPLKPMLSAAQQQHNLYQQPVSFSSHKSSAEKIEQQQQQPNKTSSFQHPRAFSASQKQNNNPYFPPPPSSVSPIKPPRNPSLDSASKLPFPQHDKGHSSYPVQQNISMLSNITPFNPSLLVCSPGTFQAPAGISASYQVKSQSPSIQSQQQYQSLKQQQSLNPAQNIVRGSDGINTLQQQQRFSNIQINPQSQQPQQQPQHANLLNLQTYNNANLSNYTNIKSQNLPQNNHTNQSQKGNQFKQDEGANQQQQQQHHPSDQEDINEGSRMPPQESAQGRGMQGSSQQGQEEVQAGIIQQSLPIVYKNTSRLTTNNNNSQMLARSIGSSSVGSQYQPHAVQSQQQQQWNGGQFAFQQQMNGAMLLNPIASGNSYHVQPLMKAQIQGGSLLSSQRGAKKEQKVEIEQIGDKMVVNELEEAKNEIAKLQKVIGETAENHKIREEKNAQAIKKLEEDNIQLIRLVETLEKRIVDMAEASENAATTGRRTIESQRQENQKYQQEAQRCQMEMSSLKEREDALQKELYECTQQLGEAREQNASLQEQLTGMKQQQANLQEAKEDIQEQFLLVNRQLENLLEEKNRLKQSDNTVEEGEGHMGSYLQSLLREKDKELEEQRVKIAQIIKDLKDFETLVTDQKDVMTQLEEKVSLLQLENNKLLEIIDVQNNISQAQHNNQQQSFHQQQQEQHAKQEQQQSLNAGGGNNSEQMGREYFNSNDYRVISEMEAKLQDLADDNQRLGSSAEQFKQQAQYWKESFELLQGQQQLQEQQQQTKQALQPQPQVQSQAQAQPQSHNNSQQQQSSQQSSQYNQSQQSSQQPQFQMQRQSVQYKQQQQQPQQLVSQINSPFYQPVLLQPVRNQQIIQLKLTPRQQGLQKQQQQHAQVIATNTPQMITQSINLTSAQQQPAQIYQSRHSLRQQVDDQRQPTLSSPNRTQQPPISSGSPSPWNPNSNIQQLQSQPIKELSRSWYYPAVPSQEQLRQVQQGLNQTPSKLLPPSYAPPRRFASADKQQGKISFA